MKKVSEYKEEDARLIRATTKKIIKDKKLLENATGAKAVVEACKTLGRLQYLFQIDKEVIRESKKPTIEKPALRAEHQKSLDKILNAKK